MFSLFCCALFLFPKTTFAAGEFITTWKTDNPGVSANNQITIPTYGSGYNYTVSWGDGNVDLGVTGDITHTYVNVGTYVVTITGDFPQIYFANGGDKQKILSVDQWGVLPWRSMENAFFGATYLVLNAVDIPNLSGVTDMGRMFQGVTAMNQNINNWDVSTVIDMNNVFNGATSFNQPLNMWNVSNATLMYSMFNGATLFNQPLNTWDVADVTDMSNMFFGATSFNQPLNTWDVSNVATLNGMFGATSFNQPLNAWDVSGALSIAGMFYNNTSFNQPLNMWNVSNTSYMYSLFEGATSFNQPLNNWNMAAAISIGSMFRNATSFNQALDTWNTGSVTNMSGMFEGATSFNQSLDFWDVTLVTDMSYMFQNATAFNQDVSIWDVSSVFTMEEMFTGVTLSEQNYSFMLMAWSALPVQANVIFSGGNSQYCLPAVSPKSDLISNYYWTITDGGINLSCVLVIGNLRGTFYNGNPGPGFPPPPNRIVSIEGNGIDDLYSDRRQNVFVEVSQDARIQK